MLYCEALHTIGRQYIVDDISMYIEARQPSMAGETIGHVVEQSAPCSKSAHNVSFLHMVLAIYMQKKYIADWFSSENQSAISMPERR